MTSRLSRVARLAARVEAEQRDRASVASMIRRYEVGQLLRETVPVDELIDLSREVHAGDEEAAGRLLEAVAEAEARWGAGDRPGGDHAARDLVDWEKNAARRRLEDLRH